MTLHGSTGKFISLGGGLLYEFVLRNWPDTLYARKAQAELDELGVKN